MGKGDHLGELEALILLALLRVKQAGEEAYGINILRELQETAGRKCTIGAVYGSLGRLEEKGMVRSWHGEPDPVRGGKARRYFEVEPPGHAALAEARAMLERMWHGVIVEAEAESSS